MTSAMSPRDMGFLDTAPWKVDVAMIMKARPAQVWAALTDNPGWVTWFKNCVECGSTGQPGGGVGSTRSIVVSGIRVDERFIAWEPERTWAFTVLAMNRSFASSMVECVRLAPSNEGGTAIDYRMALTPKWWARPVRFVLGRVVRATWIRSFSNLDRQIGSDAKADTP